MELDSYTYELCNLQRRETTNLLFFRCSFAKACWNSIGVTYISTRTHWNIINQIKNKLGVPFYMEIVILMAWSIWTTRNSWMFNSVDPSPLICKEKFSSEFSYLLLRARPSLVQLMEVVWLHTL
ncbi:hypothetical protein SETIT_4G014400v2 [Setaria italica]|uniref:Reverse transcriptase zinc-binding domain-containing protein n=1 Tax=Setaria italica TaxID=4555 RepID=A0A368QPU1_SETIT|nr:hypothetical protein SETIT_4G014400v2 [Setaria italica]